MSKILSDVVKKVYRNKRILTAIQCDRCGCQIPAELDLTTNRYSNPYYQVTTGHHEWFNDSCDSIEHRDICPGCIVTVLEEYIKSTKYDSAYIDIKRRIVYPEQHFEEVIDRKGD